MSYPTPMDVAEAEDREADLSPSEQLRNICMALAADLDNSPFTREEWVKLDADRLELIAANYAFASENERLRGLLRDIKAKPHNLQYLMHRIDAALAPTEQPTVPPRVITVPCAIEDCPKCSDPEACKQKGKCRDWLDFVTTDNSKTATSEPDSAPRPGE